MFSTPLDTLPGAKMVYSDIGAYMSGRVVEKVSGQTLDAYLHDHVFEPLGMTETMYKPPASLIARIAPTEIDPRRGGLVRGKVHDERAYYLGGVSAHAGMFSTAHDLARFAQMYLNGGTLDGTRVFDARDDRAVHDVRRFSVLESRHRLAETRSPGNAIHESVGGVGWTTHVARRIRTYRIHRNVDRDGPVERRVRHSPHQSRQSDAQQHKITAVRRQLADAVMTALRAVPLILNSASP